LEHVLPNDKEDLEKEEPEEEEDPEEDLQEEEPEEEEESKEEDMDIGANNDMDGPELIHPYEVPLTRRKRFSGIQVRIRSSSTAPVGHDPEDLVPSRIRSDLDALHGRV
ncbi:hypothetical protein Tco_0327844, partial [Tanacetum coccineum]